MRLHLMEKRTSYNNFILQQDIDNLTIKYQEGRTSFNLLIIRETTRRTMIIKLVQIDQYKNSVDASDINLIATRQ